MNELFEKSVGRLEKVLSIKDAAEFLEQTLDVLDRVAGDASQHPERRKLAENILEDFKSCLKNKTTGIFDNESSQKGKP